MKRYFADTFYYIAVIDETDSYHNLAAAWTELLDKDDRIWTTYAVLLELGNALASPRIRLEVAHLIRTLQQSPTTTVIPLTSDLLESGLALYKQRSDKEWSLTDCISFVVMHDHDFADALTGDHHFIQAGFHAALRTEADA